MKKSPSKPTRQQLDLGNALQAAMALHQGGQLAPAVAQYRAILARAPSHPDVLHYLGVALHQLGQSTEAIKLIQRALVLVPGYVDARNNLGNVQKEIGDFAAAERSYRAVLAVRPDFALAHSNLGVALKEQGRYDDAVQAYQRALALAPEFADGWLNLGHALRKTGAVQEGLTCYRKAILLKPHTIDAYRNLGRVLCANQRYEEALAVYQQWLAQEPGNPVVEHLVAACAGAGTPERASDGFLQQTFDGFANSFDQVLAGLNYCAPALVGEAVAQHLGAPQPSWRVLDAGCGTGLCVEHLRPYASELDGVDLSPGMLSKATMRGGYDELIHAELTAYFLAHPGRYDVIASADTLCYFGVLEEVLPAAASCLRADGWLVFTVEETLDLPASPKSHLHPHGRYSHTEAYVRAALEQGGLALVSVRRATLRTEADKPVAGLLVVARKTAA